MKNITLYPGSANGVVAAPASTEEALSAIVLAAITKTSVRGAGGSADTASLFNGLFEMGARFRQQGNVVTFYTAPRRGSASFGCTQKVLCLLIPLCIVLGGEYTLLGAFDRQIFSGLDYLDVDYSVSEQGITIRSERLFGDISLNNETFAAGFLPALSVADGATLLLRDGKKNLALVQAIMQDFGFKFSDEEGYAIAGRREIDTHYVYNVGGDYAKSAYPLLAGFLSGEVGVTGLLANSLQSGHGVIDDFKNLKLNVSEMNGAVFAKKSRANGGVIDMSAAAEPIVSLVIACFCKGKCTIKNADRMPGDRKEEFEIAANALSSIGADIVKIGQEYLITGKRKLFGGSVDARDSRNIALALAAAGLNSEIGVTLSNAPSLDLLQGLGIAIQ